MAVLPDAVHLRFGEHIGTFPFEWATEEMEMHGAMFPLMHHLTTEASFVIGDDDDPPAGALQRYALLVADGSLNSEDRTAIVYLGRAAIWYHLQQMPEIRAIFDERDAE